MAQAASGRSQDRARRILDGAQEAFLEQGLRGATMEGIAKRAGVAKPTLYSYYPDKEAVFRAVVERVTDRMIARAEEAFARPGPVADRVATALAAKYGVALEVLAGSPHAEELATGKAAHAGETFAAVQAWLVDRTAEALAAGGIADAAGRARIVVSCVDGLFHAAGGRPDGFAEEVRFVVSRLLEDPAG